MQPKSRYQKGHRTKPNQPTNDAFSPVPSSKNMLFLKNGAEDLQKTKKVTPKTTIEPQRSYIQQPKPELLKYHHEPAVELEFKRC